MDEAILWDKLKIKAARKAASLTADDVARSCGVTSQAIKNIEMGIRHPSPRTVIAFADLFGVKVADLMLDDHK